ncbi:MAG: InlB B-repeat-containing protein [Clostridiales bacterium]|nr:InlB B-repeat-containing protein [Clostridiales bacterium]
MKKILAVFLAAAMLAVVLPAHADDTSTTVQRTAVLDLTSATQSASSESEGWSFDPRGNDGNPLVILNNYGKENAHSAPVYLPANTKLLVYGDCYIDNELLGEMGDVLTAELDGDLTIDGTGTLNLYADQYYGKCLFLKTGGSNDIREFLYVSNITLNCYGKEREQNTTYLDYCISGGLNSEYHNVKIRAYNGKAGIYTYGYTPIGGLTDDDTAEILFDNCDVYVDNTVGGYLGQLGMCIYITFGRIRIVGDSHIVVRGCSKSIYCWNMPLIVDGGTLDVIAIPLASTVYYAPIWCRSLVITNNAKRVYVGTHKSTFNEPLYCKDGDGCCSLGSDLNMRIGTFADGNYAFGTDPDRDDLPTFEVRSNDYVPFTHVVSFVNFDGSVIEEVTVEHTKSAEAPYVPFREGYAFIGWDKEFSCVLEDMTVTAQYEIKIFLVRFLDWDGTVLSEQTVEFLGDATPPDDPYREGFLFVGWDAEYTSIRHDTVLTAQYVDLTNKLRGDVDCDGDVDFDDVSLFYAFILNQAEISMQGRINADFNDDGVPNTADITLICKFILALE